MKVLRTITKPETLAKLILVISTVIFCTLCYMLGTWVGEQYNEMKRVEKTVTIENIEELKQWIIQN